jgi:Flp pilus assembly protein TadG
MSRFSLIFQSLKTRVQPRTSSAQRGTAMVEFAFIFIVLITLMFGIMGFGHMLYAYHFVNNEAKEATRWASVNGSNCGLDSSCNGAGYMNNGPASAANINTYVQNHVPPGIDPTKVTISACGVTGGAACATSTPQVCTTTVGTGGAAIGPIPNYPGCTVQVTVSYPFQFPFALLNTVVPTATTTTAPCTKPGICLSSTSDTIIAH